MKEFNITLIRVYSDVPKMKRSISLERHLHRGAEESERTYDLTESCTCCRYINVMLYCLLRSENQSPVKAAYFFGK